MLSLIRKNGLNAALTLVLGVALGFGVAGTTHSVSGQGNTDSETTLLRTIYSRVNPSVVSITVRIPNQGTSQFNVPGNQGSPNSPTNPGFGQQQPYALAAGSGFVYDGSGHIVTNAHVVEGADNIELAFSDGIMMHAKLVGIDLDADIAVLQAQGDTSKYPAVPLANSDTLQVGDRAIAIGNPFEEAGTMTQGIVSGLHRSVSGLNQTSSGGFQIPDAIQTDAALNPGNSGGPLLNADGQIVGVNEQIQSTVRQSSGVSFAIPSNLTKTVADTLIKSGKMEHPWLGISGGSLSLDVDEALKLPANMQGAFIGSVQAGGPAAKAGLQGSSQTISINGTNATVGDIITAVDGQAIHRFDDLIAYIFNKTTVGQTVTLTVVRNGKEQQIQVTLSARPAASTTALTQQGQ